MTYIRLTPEMRAMLFELDDTEPDGLASAIAKHIGSTPTYRPVETDGAARAASTPAAAA